MGRVAKPKTEVKGKKAKNFNDAVGSQCVPMQATSVRPHIAADERVTVSKRENVPRSGHGPGITDHQGTRLLNKEVVFAIGPRDKIERIWGE